MASKQLFGMGAVLSGLTYASAALLPRQQNNSQSTITVDLSSDRGVPDQLGSGVLLGIPDAEWPGNSPDAADQIPDEFYERIGFRYNRAGGSQLPQGAWITGLDGYNARLRSSKSDYDKAKSFGAGYILMPHDLWGTDQSDNSTHWPGDNGDWDDYYAFLDQLLSDVVELDMLDMAWDIWNEPDVDIFWDRSVEQWVELYVRTHQHIRSKPELDRMEIMGPAMQIGPRDDPWWTAWFEAVSENGIPPDQYSYHLLYGPGDDLSYVDLRRFNQSMQEYLEQYDLPLRQINVNEYARPEQQVPSVSAWFLSRFERYDTFGLRANWEMECPLHDYLANLVTKQGAPNVSCSDTGYQPNGEWQMYAYYGTNMTGKRLASEGSGDGVADVFATVGDSTARILFGTLQHIDVEENTGTWYLQLDNLSSLGLPESGSLAVQTWAFVNNGHYGYIAGPEDRGVVEHEYSGDSVTWAITVDGESVETALAFEFAVAGGDEGGEDGPAPGYGEGEQEKPKQKEPKNHC